MPDICCDVCASDGVTLVTARLCVLDGPATTVRFCRPCTEALFVFLDERRSGAIAEGNAAVAEALRVFGVEGEGGGGRR